MKAILEFDLNEFDDKLAHYRCVRSLDLACVIWELALNSKKTLMHKVTYKENLTIEDAIDIFYEHLNSILDEYDIKPESLIV